MGPSPARCLRRYLPLSLPALACTSPPAPSVCASLFRLGMQVAKAFNQPLNFDTSRVTNMDGMFYVHSAMPYAQTPVVPSRVQSQFEAASPHRPPSIVCAPLLTRTTGSKGVQPEAEFRHVPRHKYGRNVLRVHSAMPYALRLQSCLPEFRVNSRLHRPTDHPVLYGPLLTRQVAKAFNQPLNFDTSRVTKMDGMFRVHSTYALHKDSSRACPCTLDMRGRPAAPTPLLSGPHVPSPPPLLTLGRARRRSTSR